MLGIDDVVFIFAATTVANLILEFGVEVLAEWVVREGGSSGTAPEVTGFFAGGGFDGGCIGAADTAFTHLVGNAPLVEQCVTMLHLVVN